MATSSRKRTVKKSTKARKSVDVSKIGAALGASRSFKIMAEPHGPFGVAALAREVQDRLVSTGGRPSDKAPTIRRLVTIRKAVWQDLQRRAARVSGWGRRVSPAQLAAILLEKGLNDLEESDGNQDRANSA
jgi:hypothetical protein